VSYLGALHEALRQLAAWVERGEEPAGSTNYAVIDGQISVPSTAAERQGVQPVANLASVEQAGHHDHLAVESSGLHRSRRRLSEDR
ncbi:hypothetical protein ACC691_39980, partial [Rhizobium johnstonii]|uniref:hypothetical protein n=1 Tax=Rhizobium johnstonii TaxID=3019933 RepID=UPI003F959D44